MSNWSIDFAPMVPPLLFWLGTVLAMVLVGVLLFRRAPGAALRALALGLVVLALATTVVYAMMNVADIAIRRR